MCLAQRRQEVAQTGGGMLPLNGRSNHTRATRPVQLVGVRERETKFFSDPAPGRTSGNRGNIEKQVPRPSEEGHGARSGESDVGRCGQAACVVTAVYSSTAVGACPRTKQPQNHPECGGRGVCMSGTCVA